MKLMTVFFIVFLFSAIWFLITNFLPLFSKVGLSESLTKVISGVFIFLTIISGASAWYFPYMEQKHEQNEERRQSALSGSILTNKIDTENENISVILGNNYVAENSSNFIDGNTFKPLLSFGYDYPFEIWQEKSGIKFNARIISIDKKIVALIKANEWVINPNNYFTRNYDESGLEIIDEYGIPVLQIDLLSSSTLYVGGFFFDKERFIIFGKNKGDSGILRDSVDNILKAAENMTKLFKYPATSHLGERE